MYYISSGDCAVNIRDKDRKILVAKKLLVEGDHFGEIGIVFGCRRTATIISRNYNTMAIISSAHYKDLINEIPIYETALK